MESNRKNKHLLYPRVSVSDVRKFIDISGSTNYKLQSSVFKFFKDLRIDFSFISLKISSRREIAKLSLQMRSGLSSTLYIYIKYMYMCIYSCNMPSSHGNLAPTSGVEANRLYIRGAEKDEVRERERESAV